MSTTLATLKRWYEYGESARGYSHLIVACDVFDWEDYPIYVPKGEDPRDHIPDNGDRVMECYDFRLGWELQSKERRANHWEIHA